MLLVNYRTKIWTKKLKTTNQGLDEQKIIKTKNWGHWQTRQKKVCPDIFLSQQVFLSGQKSIYHQVEFHPLSPTIKPHLPYLLLTFLCHSYGRGSYGNDAPILSLNQISWFKSTFQRYNNKGFLWSRVKTLFRC